MGDLVQNVLLSINAKDSKYKSTDVSKDIDLELDLGNLLAMDQNPLNTKRLRLEKEDYIKSLARDNTQLLLNKIWENHSVSTTCGTSIEEVGSHHKGWRAVVGNTGHITQLPIEHVEDAVVAELPDPATRLPREKPIPQAKAATKWQEYAKLKSIQKRKKGRMIWNDISKEWQPRWGYKRASDVSKEWLIEVPQNADPYEDQFEKLKKAKKERVAKNELQRLRNIARNMKGKVPGVGLTPTENPDKEHVSRALYEAKKSTASVGRFTETLPKEKTTKRFGKKRKFESNFGDAKNEKRRALEILGKIHNKKPLLDVKRAANMEMSKQQRNRASAKKNIDKSKQKPKGQMSKSKKGKKEKSNNVKRKNTK